MSSHGWLHLEVFEPGLLLALRTVKENQSKQLLPYCCWSHDLQLSDFCSRQAGTALKPTLLLMLGSQAGQSQPESSAGGQCGRCLAWAGAPTAYQSNLQPVACWTQHGRCVAKVPADHEMQATCAASLRAASGFRADQCLVSLGAKVGLLCCTI